jgi:hypothetical protein
VHDQEEQPDEREADEVVAQDAGHGGSRHAGDAGGTARGGSAGGLAPA